MLNSNLPPFKLDTPDSNLFLSGLGFSVGINYESGISFRALEDLENKCIK